MKNKIELLNLISETMALCEDFPCGGIGHDGATQDELTAAHEAGHPFGNDDTFHRGQQIWLNLNKLTQMVQRLPNV